MCITIFTGITNELCVKLFAPLYHYYCYYYFGKMQPTFFPILESTRLTLVHTMCSWLVGINYCDSRATLSYAYEPGKHVRTIIRRIIHSFIKPMCTRWLRDNVIRGSYCMTRAWRLDIIRLGFLSFTSYVPCDSTHPRSHGYRNLIGSHSRHT